MTIGAGGRITASLSANTDWKANKKPSIGSKACDRTCRGVKACCGVFAKAVPDLKSWLREVLM